MNEIEAKKMLRKMAGLIREREPSAGISFYQSGLQLFRDRAFEPALDCFLSSTEIDPDFAFAYYYAGRAYRTLGNFAEARAMFERSVTLNSYHAPSQAYLGDIFLKEDNLIEAEKCFREAINLQPDNRLSLASLARLAKQGSIEKQTVIELLRAAYFQGSRDSTVLMELFSLQDPDKEMCISLGDELFREQSYYRAAFFYKTVLDRSDNDQKVRNKYEECIELLNRRST
jgi:tetratricopeptide (TPR) repeat protein